VSSHDAWRYAFHRHLASTSPEPIGIVVDRAEGPFLYAPDGRRYIDLLAGIGVANIGHMHPEVIEAVERQIRRHHHVMVYGEYVQEAQALYAEELVAAAPPGLDRVYFVNSGAEAVEGALKVARKATGRTGLVCFRGAYHGDTMGALSVVGSKIYRTPFEPLLEPVTVLSFGDGANLEAIDESVGAVIVEPVQGEGGVRVPPVAFLPALRARCTEVGALLVLDEVMTGFGRTGSLYACTRSGVLPDILVHAKALGGGFPLGAFLASEALMSTLAKDPPLCHVTTFGGHPVSCAAGRAALRVLLRDDLPRRAEVVGARFRARLRETLAQFSQVREVRGAGLMIGIELCDPVLTTALVETCRDRGVLLGWTLHHDHILRLTPPLNVPESVLEEALEILAAALGDLTGSARPGA